MDESKAEHQHVEPVGSSQAPIILAGDKNLRCDAADADQAEHSLTIKEAIKIYYKAIGWCLVISTCVIMEGYDQILVQSLYAYPQFQIKFGEYVGIGTTGYQLSAAWQAGLSNASGVGAFFGALLNG